MNLHRFGYLIIAISAVGCAEIPETNLNSDSDTYDSKVIIQHRDPSLPKIKYRKMDEKSRSGGAVYVLSDNSDEMLGYGYKIGNSILGDIENVSGPILNLKRIKSIKSSYVTSSNMNKSVCEYYTYSNFDRYVSKSNLSKTVSSGFSLNLGIFKIGRQKTTTTTIITLDSITSKSVFGELNINYITSKSNLNATASSLKLYGRRCLDEVFKQSLYYSFAGNVLEEYGPFLLTDYLIGARVNALYYGETKTGLSIESKETSMSDAIQMSFSWSNDSLGASLKFSGKNGSATASEYKTENTRINFRIYGGDYELIPSFTAKLTPEFEFDFGAWLKSLSDNGKHTLIGIGDGGLIPLSSVMIESNFRQRFEDTINGYLPSDISTQMYVPEVSILRVYAKTSTNGENLYEIAPVLITRHGDMIVLSNGKYKQDTDEALSQNIDNSVYANKAINEIYPYMNGYFNGLIYSYDPTKIINTYVRIPLSIRIDNFDPENMYHYIDEETNMGYIYNISGRHAFAYYIDPEYEDSVLDEYGIRDWVENLPVRKISATTLSNSYTIIGI